MEYRDSARVRELLAQGVLLFDGATGTALCAQSGEGEAVERLCLTQPQRVLSLHRAYLAAGSRAIKTNTFAAHVSLACENEDDQKKLIRAAYDLARRAGDAYDAAVFADIGPAPTDADAAACYIAMAEQFLNVGATCFLSETMQSGEGLAEAAAHIKASCPDAWIMVSFAADADGFTRAGEQASALALQMSACGAVDAIGLNCICGAYHIRQLLSTLDVGDKLMSAMPNAGYPHVEEGRTYYDSAPAYYAQQVMECVKAGARIVGGCCGTTPEHIRQIARLLGTPMPPRVRMGDEKAAQLPEKECRSRILRRLEQGRRITLVELDPPRSADIGGFMEGARRLEQAGADAITIADCPIGRARMDSSLLACKLSRELGIEALPHMTCRDRNVNATKALLLGLSMENVHNVLVVTGDPIPTGDRGSVKSVYQFNSRVLAKFIRGLGESGEAEPFFVCGGLNINAVRFDLELERAKEKMDCGVSAFLTQPVLSEQAARHLERARDELRGAKLIGGLFPVVSEKNARFLQSEVHGITVDEAVVRAYAGLDRAQGEDMAVRLCREAASRISPFVDGYYMMTPFQRVELVCRVIRATQNLAE